MRADQHVRDLVDETMARMADYCRQGGDLSRARWRMGAGIAQRLADEEFVWNFNSAKGGGEGSRPEIRLYAGLPVVVDPALEPYEITLESGGGRDS